ncbi:MAG: VWA-like domain-containing protein [Tannerella sp.]|jgi:predicted metal-dependent peptidase|nr:VWA-like domain-containing protein [Tannerella sp.]
MKSNIEKAKTSLVLSQPFFATIALGLKYVEDINEKTASTNGIILKYNPDYINGMTVEETVGLLAHEVLHIVNLHHLRREGRDTELWNKACDYAINGLLNNKFKLPKNGLYNNRYDNMNAETIYADLQSNQSDNNGNGDNEGTGTGDGTPDNKPQAHDFGRIEDAPANTPEEKRQMEIETMGKIVQAVMAGKNAGNIPGGIEQMVEAYLYPKIDWKTQLRHLMSEITTNDYTWSKPNRRYIYRGIYLPTLESPEIGKTVVAIDTSGSIDDDMLSDFYTEMKEISESVKLPVTVIYCDCDIRSVSELEDKPVYPVGRGGTDIIPVFRYIEEHIPECKVLVYFTDGLFNDFPDEPGYTTIWAITKNQKFKPPFGETVLF